MTDLLLRRVSRRPAAQGDEEYDVLADGAVVGRIMKAYAEPVGSPWFWTLGYGYGRSRRARSRRVSCPPSDLWAPPRLRSQPNGGAGGAVGGLLVKLAIG